MSTAFDVGTRARIVRGRCAGRTGKVLKVCGHAFPEWRRVELERKPRERTRKVAMVDVADLEPAATPAQLAYIRAAAWCVFVGDRVGDRLLRYARSEHWPHDPPEYLDHTAHAIYQRARERLAAARDRLSRDRSSTR